MIGHEDPWGGHVDLHARSYDVYWGQIQNVITLWLAGYHSNMVQMGRCTTCTLTAPTRKCIMHAAGGVPWDGWCGVGWAGYCTVCVLTCVGWAVHCMDGPGGGHVSRSLGGGHASKSLVGGDHASRALGGGHASWFLGGGHVSRSLGDGHASIFVGWWHAFRSDRPFINIIFYYTVLWVSLPLRYVLVGTSPVLASWDLAWFSGV